MTGYKGAGQVLRYNWPAYATAAGVLGLSLVAPRRLRRPLVVIGLTGAWFAAASLVVTNLVYDRSEYAAWEWPLRLFERPPRRVAILHAGLDNVSASLRRLWPDTEIQVVDFYDAATMTEPAIARARAGRRHGDPLSDIGAELDAVFIVLAAHELRTRPGRADFFRRVRGALAPRGRVVLLEHLRDVQNAAVYGPGALHFLPRKAYLAAFEDAGLDLLVERAMTPFLRLFVLGR